MKELLHRFLSGMILGLGFLATIAISAWVYGLVEQASVPAANPPAIQHRGFGPHVQLVIASHAGVYKPEGFTVTGVIHNGEKSAWGRIKLSVELYDKAGALLDVCDEYFQGTIAPGTDRNFLVRCYWKSETIPPPRPDSYKITIDDAEQDFDWTGT